MIQTIVIQELAKLSVPKGVTLSAKDTESITSKAVAAIKAKEGEFGVKLLGLEFRMMFFIFPALLTLLKSLLQYRRSFPQRNGRR